MPDHGERPAEEIERKLEASCAIFPPPDYGSTLLGRGLSTHPASGGRKVNGGIMVCPTYKSPTVNIRPPKWTDCKFWIRAKDYEEAQFIADGVFYHIGKEPFHFCDANFQYPPLRLGTRELLLTREMCSAYVKSIAKGPAHQKQREDYRERVKELVLKAVKSPEAALFLKSLRAFARPVTNFEATEDSKIVDDGNEAASTEDESHSTGLSAEEPAGNFDDAESTEQATPMEVDNLSEQAIQSLVPLSSDVSETVDPMGGLAYIASFGIDWFDSGSILRSEGQSLGAGCSHLGGKAEEHKTFNNMEGFLTSLDKDEEEGWRPTENADWMSLRPQPNISHHTLRYNRVLPSPDPDCEAL